jgi:hypothetical protein
MCPSGATCLTTDGCFGELARKFTFLKSVGLIQSGHHYHFIKMQRVLAMMQMKN